MLLPRLLLLLAPALLVAAAGRIPAPGAAGAAPLGLALPLHFEPNRGQADARVRFLSRGGRHALFLTDAEAVLRLTPPPGGRTAVLRTRLLGARPPAGTAGVDALPGRVHYFLGRDPSGWRANIPLYAGVRAEGVYPGVDLHYYGRPGALEYDFVVAPGAEPGQVRLAIAGAERVELDGAGDLRLRTPAGDVVQRKPVAYQERQGRREVVAAAYRVTETPEGAEVAFALGEYDRERPLVIDPVISFGTLLGGTGFDRFNAVVADAAGEIYAAGASSSIDFPVVDGIQPQPAGLMDAVVVKVRPSELDLAYATYLGGAGSDSCLGMAIDAAGAVYLAGQTDSADFPLHMAVQPDPGGDLDGFAAKLAPDGSALAYSSYLGGSGIDFAADVDVHSTGTAFIAGTTGSTDFPVLAPAQPAFGGALDMFVTALRPRPEDGALYSTYVGGAGPDLGAGVAVDATGRAHLIGIADAGFPVLNAAQPAFGGGGGDAGVVRLSAAGAVQYSTYLGGPGADHGSGIALDAAGITHITGGTSGEFPVLNPLQPDFGGGNQDAWFGRLSAGGSGFLNVSYLGGSGDDSGVAVALNASGSPFILGSTRSTDFPILSPLGLQFEHHGATDAFLSCLNSSGTQFRFSTYLGAGGFDDPMALASIGADGAIAAGMTTSADFPVHNPLQGHAGGFDAFLTVVIPTPSIPTPPSNLTAGILPGGFVELNWRDNSNNEDAFLIDLRIDAGPFEAYAGVHGNQTRFLDPTSRANAVVTYRVLATNLGGTSAPSNEAQVTVPPPPAAPTGLSGAILSATRARLEWTDASPDEEGFVVEVSRVGVFVDLGTTGPGETVFEDAALAPGVTATYRVRAFNIIGRSASSNSVQLQVPAGGRLKLSPARLNFGTVASGEIRTKRLTVTNRGTAHLIGTLEVLGGPFRIVTGGSRFNLAPRERLRVTLEFGPEGVGAANSTLRVTSTDGARQQLSVPLTGTGR